MATLGARPAECTRGHRVERARRPRCCSEDRMLGRPRSCGAFATARSPTAGARQSPRPLPPTCARDEYARLTPLETRGAQPAECRQQSLVPRAVSTCAAAPPFTSMPGSLSVEGVRAGDGAQRLRALAAQPHPHRLIFRAAKPQESSGLWLTLGISRSGAHSYTRRCRLHAKLDCTPTKQTPPGRRAGERRFLETRAHV